MGGFIVKTPSEQATTLGTVSKARRANKGFSKVLKMDKGIILGP